MVVKKDTIIYVKKKDVKSQEHLIKKKIQNMKNLNVPELNADRLVFELVPEIKI